MMNKVNPTLKMIVVMICAVTISFHFSVKWNLVLIGFCFVLMVLSKADMKKLLIVLAPATLAAASIFFAMYFNGTAADTAGSTSGSGNFFDASAHAANLNDAIAIGLRIYAYCFLGMLFALTTRTNNFIYSLMEQAHLKPKFAYGELAAFNLLPMINREFRQIKLAYRVRGYHIMPWSMKPAFSALVNTTHWSETIAMAMESKGFDEDGARTYYLELHTSPWDYVWAVVIVAICSMGYTPF